MRLTRFLSLALRHHRLLVRCFILLVQFRWTLTRKSYHPLLDLIRQQTGTESQSVQPDLLAWGVLNAARLVPFATCLTQSLVLRYMLARCGHDASIRIGVKIDEVGRFRAHAWVIHDNRLLIGGPEEKVAPYRALVDL